MLEASLEDIQDISERKGTNGRAPDAVLRRCERAIHQSRFSPAVFSLNELRRPLCNKHKTIDEQLKPWEREWECLG